MPWCRESARNGCLGLPWFPTLYAAVGDRSTEQLIDATKDTRAYLQDMGAKVATSKSALFAITKDARTKLSKYVWPYDNKNISVTNFYGTLEHTSTSRTRCSRQV